MVGLPFAHLPNAWLLLALVLQVLSYPFRDHYHGGRAVIAAVDLAILVLALRASCAGGHETWLGYVRQRTTATSVVVRHVAQRCQRGARTTKPSTRPRRSAAGSRLRRGQRYVSPYRM